MLRRVFCKAGLAAAAFLAGNEARRREVVAAVPDTGAGPAPAASRGASPGSAPAAQLEALGGTVAVAGEVAPAGMVLRANRQPLPPGRVADRLEEAMRALLGETPWERLFGPDDTVALKLNGLAAPHLSPRRELVDAIVAGLEAAGVAPERIILFERTTRELERCGYALQIGPGAVRAYGTDALRGGGYSGDLAVFGEVGSFVSRVVTEYATALINVGVLKDHDLAGVSAGMKNLYGLIHNPNRYHDHTCDPYVAQVTALPAVRAKLRLTVIDAVLAQCHGGPAYRERWTWPCGRILVGCDPVAVDAVGSTWIAEERARRGLPSLAEAGREPVWLRTAAELGLGRREGLRIHAV